MSQPNPPRCFTLIYPEGVNYARNLRGSESLAARHGPGARGLSLHQFVPQAGNLRPDQPVEARSSFGAQQYRRGQGTFFPQGVASVLIPRQGILVGASDANYHRMRTRISVCRDVKKLADLASEVGRLLNGLVNRFKSPVESGFQVLDPWS